MPFSIQNHKNNKIISTRILAPIINNEFVQVYRDLYKRLARRKTHETTHVVMDISDFDDGKQYPIQVYVKVLSKLYEQWYSNRLLTLWLVVDESQEDITRYLAQKMCVPVYIYTDPFDVYKEIDKEFNSETAPFKTETLADYLMTESQHSSELLPST